MTDTGNQIAWIVHSCNSLDPSEPSNKRCLTLCAMPFLLAPRTPQLVTRNPQPVTRNPQPVTRNPQPVTRNP